MKIDSHQHFWRYNTTEFSWINDGMRSLRRDFLPDELGKELVASAFDGSIAVQARQHLEETRWLMRLADEHPFVKGVVGWVDLCSPEVEDQLSLFSADKKFVGVRHIVQDEPDDRFLLRADFVNGIHRVLEHDLSYDILVYPKQLPAAVEFVSLFPDARFVIDHMAKPSIRTGARSAWKEQMKELAGHPGVFCKVSGMVTEADWQSWKPGDFTPYLDTVFEFFGTHRVMVGSDWPVCTLAGSYRAVLSIVLDYVAPLPEEERSAVLGGNAVRAYKLKTA